MKDKVFLDTNIFIYSVDSSPTLKEKSEDLQDGLHVGDLIIKNPFIADDFIRA